MKTYIFKKNQKLVLKDFIQLCSPKAKIGLSPYVKEIIKKNRKKLEQISGEKIIYGINTGFGALSGKIIPRDKLDQLQENLIQSHACGVGKMLKPEIVKGMLILLINSLSKGYSGIRLETIEALVKIFNKNIIPQIPEKGSVGSSGDLSPLAHMALVLIGKGEVVYKNEKLKGKEALSRAGLHPVRLKAKEGLALINGTHLMTATAALAVWRAENLVKIADIASAMSLEATLGTDKNFAKCVHELKPHRGQLISAGNIRRLIKGSEIIISHQKCSQVQDVYSLRCASQIQGASGDAVSYVKKIIGIEMNSVTDNPLIFPNGEVFNTGNFHGQSIALACDFLSIAVAELADVSERRINYLISSESGNVPKFLIKNSGFYSGLMISQYTAASLVSCNKVLAHPASVDSIPTSNNKEDHVSMGTNAAQKSLEIIYNSENVLAIELLCAAQALDYFQPKMPGRGVKKAHETIRKAVSFLKKDRIISKDINRVYRLIRDRAILKEVEKFIGELK